MVNIESLKYEDIREKVENSSDHPNEMKKIAKELEDRAKIPTHKEILDVEEAGSHDTKLEVAQRCMTRGLEGMRKNGSRMEGLDEAKSCYQTPGADFRTFMLQEIISDKIKREQGDPEAETNPAVYFQPVMNKNIFGKETGPSGEALIVTRLRNGGSPDENTVVVTVCKYPPGGLLKYDEITGLPEFEGTSLWKVYTEKEYLKALGYTDISSNTEQKLPEKSSDKTYVKSAALLAQGEITCKEYKKIYKKENRMSLEQHWKEWDEDIKIDPEYGRSERLKGEIITRLEGRYQELKDEADKKMGEIRLLRKNELAQRNIELEEQAAGLMEKYGDYLDSEDSDIVRWVYDTFERLGYKRKEIELMRKLAESKKAKNLTPVNKTVEVKNIPPQNSALAQWKKEGQKYI